MIPMPTSSRRRGRLSASWRRPWRRSARPRQPVQPFTDQQVTEFGRRFAQIGHQEVAGIVRNEFRKTWGLLLGGVLLVLVVGIGIGWIIWGRGPTLTCADQQGGRVCWAWT